MTTSTDYIPSTDADFSAWLNNFITFADANTADLGLTKEELAPLKAAATDWDTAYSANIAAQAAAKGTGATKNAARSDAEALARPLVQRLQSTGTVKDAHRQSLGINVRSTKRTAVGEPTTRPIATIDTSQRLQHTISFVDELTPGNRAKPAGVTGCELWVKIGGVAPTDPSELNYLATDTRTPYTAVFDGADGGKIAYYMLRWVNRRGDRGPWSQTVAGTITA
jgi:hypothetical protein